MTRLPADNQLDRALVSGIAWTAVLRWTAQAFSWCATFYAARLIVPGDYGIVAMATLAIGLVRMIEDFGLDSILVQDRTVVGEQQAHLAGLILIVGAALMFLFLALAQPIATFFKEPHVAWAVAGLSGLFIADALQVVPRAALQRRLEFRRLALLALVQTLATQVVLVAGAAAGWGFWALIAGSNAGALAVTALLLTWHPYPVHWPRDLARLTRPLLQGWRVIVQRIAWYTVTSADQAIIGRLLGKEPLGAYSFATTLANQPFQEVSAVVSRVVPGVFSQVQERRDALRRYFLTLTEFLTYLALPISVGLGLTADLAVPVVLGPNWDAVIVPLRLLCVYTAFQGCQILIAHVLMWTGQFRAIMWCTVFAAIVMPIGFIAGARFGLPGIGLVWGVLYPLVNIPPLVIGFRTVSVTLGDWLRALAPAASGCVVMAAAVLGVRAALPADMSDVAGLAITAAVGATVYALVLWLVFRRRLLGIVGVVRAARAPGAVPIAASTS
jgi:O-antigen/teichoic acid export membrane protein